MRVEPRSTPIAVIAALGSERQCLGGLAEGPAGISILQSGPGASRAAAAARDALAGGARGLVSWGFAAGLRPELAPGTLVLPARVLGPGGTKHEADPAWRAALLDTLRGELALSEGDLVTVEQLLAAASDKARIARISGAAAADMESAPIAAAAREAGVVFVAMRVVLDAANDALPRQADRWIDPAGNRRAAPILGAALKPWHWATLLALGARHRKARATLTVAARRLLPSRFAWPGAPEPAR